MPYKAPFLMLFIEYNYWRRTKETDSIISNIDGILAVPDVY
ncbi:hypothetical protein FM107_14820 [Sphingobacterium sp. JB170]|nr:hypothetical protein FM107_14820 [Sphingobacterium sp. JB170]